MRFEGTKRIHQGEAAKGLRISRAGRTSNAISQRNLRAGLAFASPWLFGFLTLIVGPMLLSLFYSLTNFNLLRPPKFVGLFNYQFIFTDPEFWLSFGNTMLLVCVIVPLNVLASIGYGVLMHASVRGQRWFRTILYLPTVMPAVAQGMLWAWLFNPDFGLVNGFLSLFGVQGPNWLGDLGWGRAALIIIWLWGAGTSSVLILSALRNVPSDLYNQAEVDGASVFWRFRYVTLPQISPVIFFNLVTNLVAVLQYFTQGYILFGDRMPFLLTYIYQYAFGDLSMGIASAASWIMLVLTAAMVFALFASQRFWVYYED